MANARAPLASFGLEDAKVSLTPTNSRRALADPLEAQEPASVGDVRSFPSMSKPRKQELKPYPVRLSGETIARLEKLRNALGVVPAEFIRDAVISALDDVERRPK